MNHWNIGLQKSCHPVTARMTISNSATWISICVETISKPLSKKFSRGFVLFLRNCWFAGKVSSKRKKLYWEISIYLSIAYFSAVIIILVYDNIFLLCLATYWSGLCSNCLLLIATRSDTTLYVILSIHYVCYVYYEHVYSPQCKFSLNYRFENFQFWYQIRV